MGTAVESKPSGSVPYLLLLVPLCWGALSYLVFSLLRPWIPISELFSIPIWAWLWILQIGAFSPFWIWMRKKNLEGGQITNLKFPAFGIPLGSHKQYLVIAHLAALSALPFANTWYATHLVFAAIVSPIFEELFSRNFLTPWLQESLPTFLTASALSSTAFALMHWGFNNASAFDLSIHLQFYKFLSHFSFAMTLCFVFRLSRCLPLLIWLHVIANLSFLLSQT